MKSYLPKDFLRKLLLFLPLYMVGGYFFRNYQLQKELLYDGSLISGAFAHKILLVLAVSFAVAYACIFFFTKPQKTFQNCFSRCALSCGAQLLAGLGLIVGNLLSTQSADSFSSVYSRVSFFLSNSLPYWGVLAGMCILIFAVRSYKEQKPSPVLYMFVSLYLVIRLIVHFQAWNTDPSIHDYAYTLLFAISSMLGCFQVAGFCFDKGGRRVTGFWCVCSVFFGAVSAPDVMGDTSAMLVHVALVLLTLVMTLEMVFAKEEEEGFPEAKATEEAPEARE